jgi:hypothetical protein
LPYRTFPSDLTGEPGAQNAPMSHAFTYCEDAPLNGVDESLQAHD